MTGGVDQRLLVVTPSLGVVSETFITRHCTALAPGNVEFAAFEADPQPAWAIGLTTLVPQAPKPNPTLFERARDRLRPSAQRHATRGVWWVEEDAITSVLDRVRTQAITCVLLEYLDRWLNLIPPLVEEGVRVVVHGHGYDLSSSLRNPPTVAAYRRFLPQADAVVVPSRFAADRLERNGVPDVQVIPYGIPIPPAPSRGVAPRPPRLLSVGRLVAKKNPIGLLHGVALARSRGADFRVDLVGDGPLAGSVRKTIRAHSLEDIVVLHGALEHRAVLELMRNDDMLLQCSVTAEGGDEEGLPLVILEAMAACLPVVATRHAGIPEAVIDGVTGLLGAEGDDGAVASAIVRYCSDPDLRTGHGLAGRERVEQLFGWDDNRTRLHRVLGLPEWPRGGPESP